jgi:hypothetical protein
MEPIRVFKKEEHFTRGKFTEESTLKIYPDDDPLDPRVDYDNLGHMVCFHRRYKLGDDTNLNSEEFNGWDDLEKYLEEEYGAIIIIPLYLYDHSGLRMSVGDFMDRWDSGRVGFIYATFNDIQKEFGDTMPEAMSKARECLIQEVKTYDAYLSGDFVYYIIEDKDGEVIDSCGGFTELKDILDYTGFTMDEEV